jgi:hypothetical protein
LRILSQFSLINIPYSYSLYRVNRLNSFEFRRNYSTKCKDNSVKLDPNFVTGLTESEGSFSVTKYRDTKAKHGLTVGLLNKINKLLLGFDPLFGLSQKQNRLTL